jgi:hypothetical protein
MSKPTEKPPLPAHLRPLCVAIPRTWTPEQALAAFELIDDLRDKIWALYSCQLQPLLREELADHGDDDRDDALDERSF